MVPSQVWEMVPAQVWEMVPAVVWEVVPIWRPVRDHIGFREGFAHPVDALRPKNMPARCARGGHALKRSFPSSKPPKKTSKIVKIRDFQNVEILVGGMGGWGGVPPDKKN